MPEPNDNFSMTVGNKVIVDAVFRDTGLDPKFLTYQNITRMRDYTREPAQFHSVR